MKELPQGTSCFNCRYSREIRQKWPGPDELEWVSRQCHYNPPIVEKGFPSVKDDDFCREFLSK